jgi:Tfp pilus assembly protein PilO
MENLLTSRGFKVKTLSGIDDIALAGSETQTKPVPVEIPFQLGVVGSFTSIQDLVGVLERSVRPISINNIKLSGSDNSLELTINAKTYYQPGKNLNVTTKVIK